MPGPNRPGFLGVWYRCRRKRGAPCQVRPRGGCIFAKLGPVGTVNSRNLPENKTNFTWKIPVGTRTCGLDFEEPENEPSTGVLFYSSWFCNTIWNHMVYVLSFFRGDFTGSIWYVDTLLNFDAVVAVYASWCYGWFKTEEVVKLWDVPFGTQCGLSW